jgi:DNA (cytosine-5)-methyltransferase 1
MKYLSLCSGIEAATVAWHPLGWEAVAYSEIERFPSEVLAHHYPNTPNLGDMTKFKEWTNVSNVDLLVGGTPCQSFSVAGLRKGLDDPRGNLMLTYLAIAKQYRPNWLVWENVPGVLSSNGGRDFGSFLGGLAECGYGFAYRVLDAQFFGVAQRRRRVFVVGHLGDWRAAAAVLFERHSLQGHPAPSREKRQSAAASAGSGASVGSLCARTGQSISVQDAAQGHLMPAKPQWWDGGDLAATITTKSDDQRMPDKANAQLVMQPVYEMHGQDSRVRELGETCTTVTSKWGTGGGNVPVALQPTIIHGTQDPCVSDIAFAQGRNNGGENVLVQSIAFGFDAYNHTIQGQVNQPLRVSSAPGQVDAVGGIVQGMAVRRLTPVECERLQGFPDNYTDIRSKEQANT